MQSVATIEELNDASRQKISEKMHGWDQSLPRRRMETTKRIENDFQRKGKIVIYNDVEEEDLNEDSHILKSGGTNINNEFIVESIFCMHFLSIHFKMR